MPKVVDIHTHMYPPSYMALLESRAKTKSIPYVLSLPDNPIKRLIILPNEDSPSTPSTSLGRPIGPSYYSLPHKLSFMHQHRITTSIISLANPWLDFLPAASAAHEARKLNDEMNTMCAAHPGKLFIFATLPVSATVEEICAEVQRVKTLPHVRGVVMGTGGLGRGEGLDDPALEPVWRALSAASLPVFLHPHYGLPESVFGPRRGEYGHVLPLALGFPLETTIAVARLYLSGVFDRVPGLTMLLAHSGGTLPFLAGRLESCVRHDAHLMGKDGWKGRRGIWEVLKTNVLLDAVLYSEVGLKAAVEASGWDRVLFGTDHPFFPPLEEGGKGEGKEEGEWLSVTTNYKAIRKTFCGDAEVEEGDTEKVDAVLGGNAIRLLRLE